MNLKSFSLITTLLLTSGCLTREVSITSPISPPSQFTYQDNSSIKNGAHATYQLDWWNTWNDPQLSNLIYQALSNNLGYKQLLDRVKESRDLLRIRTTQSYPVVGLGAQAGRQKVILPQKAEYFARQQGFGIKWEMDLFGAKKSKERSAYEKYLSLNSQKHAAQLLLSTEVAETYLHILSLLKKEKTITEMIYLQSKMVSLSKKLWSMGLLDLANKNKVLNDYENLETKKYSVIKYINLYKIRLAVLLGKNPEDFVFNNNNYNYKLIDDLLIKAPIPSSPLPIDVLNKRWDVGVQYHILKSAMHDAGAAEASLYPQLTFGYDMNGQSIEIFGKNLSDSIYSLGFSLSIPFFSEPLRGQLQAKKDAVERQKEKYKETIITALAEVERAYVELHASIKERVHQEEVVKNAKQSLEKCTNEYNSGMTDYSKLVQLKMEELKEEASLDDRKEQQLNNTTTLYKSMGGYWKIDGGDDPALRES